MIVARAQYKLCVLKKGVRLSKIVRTACTFGMIFQETTACHTKKERLLYSVTYTTKCTFYMKIHVC